MGVWRATWFCEQLLAILKEWTAPCEPCDGVLSVDILQLVEGDPEWGCLLLLRLLYHMYLVQGLSAHVCSEQVACGSTVIALRHLSVPQEPLVSSDPWHTE